MRFAPAAAPAVVAQSPESPEAADSPDKAAIADSPAFLRTISTTLTRLAAGGPLFYVEPGGTAQAVITHQQVVMNPGDKAGALIAGESPRHLTDRFDCFDLDDTALFYVERYRATNDLAFTVCAPDALPLATYVRHNGLVHDSVDLRDGTGAPVAGMRWERHRWELIETGGGEIGFCWSQPKMLGEVVDQDWGLTLFERPDVVDRRGLLAAPVVCRLFWDPGPRARAHPEDVDLADRAGFLIEGF